MQNNKKYIRKTYVQGEDYVSIYLEDTRDNYVLEDALGKIGSIAIEKEATIILPDTSSVEEIDKKEEILLHALVEILGFTKINFASLENYEIVKRKIADGTLQELGYTLEAKNQELEEYDVLENLNRHRYH